MTALASDIRRFEAHLVGKVRSGMNTTTANTRARSRGHSVAWWTIVLLSWIIVLYGALFLMLRERIFPPDLAESFKARPWGIYPHVIVGMIGLAIGPLQFHPRIQANTRLHHRLGIVYIGIGILVGIVGMYMAIYSFGGMITHLGFGLLGLAVLITTGVAYRKVLSHKYAEHREWMIRSYALIFAAPTLRLWLPLLIIAYEGEFRPAYLWVSWVCWVPNVMFAEWYIRYSRRRTIMFAGAPLDHRTSTLVH
jgi:hypothetical protein